MGSNHSTVLHAVDIASYDDSNIREYLVDLVNNDPESFEDFDDEDLDYVRPYGPIRENRKRISNLLLPPLGLLISSEAIKVPGSFEDRLFRKRFRLPYALFLNFVKQAKDKNIFEEVRCGKIAVE